MTGTVNRPRCLPEDLRYVLITAARDEAAYIERTITSVISQTVLPARWVIVSDGSTDGTEEIVQRYVARHDWMELLRVPKHAGRSFASKARAFNAAFAKLKSLEFEFVGNVDGDISFDASFFEFLLTKCSEDRRLDVVGTVFSERGRMVYNYDFVGFEHVSGPCQLFRRSCFEEIGGYAPIKSGGIDLVAVISARMKGCQTRTFVEKSFDHHRPMGLAGRSTLAAKFNDGCKDYALGGHPLWEILRSVYKLARRPFFVGGVALLVGYVWSALRHAPKPVSKEFVKFRRQEQMQRLKRILRRAILHDLHDRAVLGVPADCTLAPKPSSPRVAIDDYHQRG